jgi:1,4-alpha-glucan branching enzyme
MVKAEDDYFRTKVELENGIYYYKFRVQSKSLNFEPDQWVDVIDPDAADVDEGKKTGVIQIKDGR